MSKGVSQNKEYGIRVSAIIPTFNRADSVGEAVRSVLRQTYRDFEVIVVDDGSTDRTPAVLAEFGGSIRVIRQENAGVSAARNAGIRAACGEWLAFLDSDDVWLPDKLERQMRDLNRCQGAIAHMMDARIEGYRQVSTTLFSLHNVAGTFEAEPVRRRPLLDVLAVQFFTPTWLVRTREVREERGFNERLPIYEDFELLTRLALRGTFVVSAAVGVVVRRVVSAAKPLSDQYLSNAVCSFSALCQLYEGLLGRPELTREERHEVRRRLSGARFELSVALERAGRRMDARRERWHSVQDNRCLKSVLRAFVGSLGGGSLWTRMLKRARPGMRAFRRSEMDAARARAGGAAS